MQPCRGITWWGLIRADVGSAGESKISLALSLPHRNRADIGRIAPPHALKIFLCFVNQQSISIHDCSGGVRVWDTLPCLHTGVSYPGAFIPPGTSPPEAARESEKPAGKSFEKFKGKDREPLQGKYLRDSLSPRGTESRCGMSQLFDV